jgi:hypothetical protein
MYSKHVLGAAYEMQIQRPRPPLLRWSKAGRCDQNAHSSGEISRRVLRWENSGLTHVAFLISALDSQIGTFSLNVSYTAAGIALLGCDSSG